MMLLRWRKGNGGVEPCDANDRTIEIVEGFFIDDGGDFSGEASGAGVLVQNDDLIRLLDGLRDGFAIDGNERAQVEDFDLDAFFGENLCGFERRMHHCGIRDDAEISAFARHARFADWDDVIVGGDFFFDPAIEIFVLEEDAGIVVANGGFDQAFGVVGRGGADDFQARIVDEPHLGILRVEGAAVDISAAGTAKDERRGSSPEIVRFRDHVRDLVHGAGDEIHELEFGDGTHARERGSEGRADDSGLGDRRVDDALRAEAVDETVSDFKSTPVYADVFAEAEDGGVVFHFFPDSLADGFEVCELHVICGCDAQKALKSYQSIAFPILVASFGTGLFSTLTSIPRAVRVHRTRCLRVPPREHCLKVVPT
jgi:hypothetical protein